MFVIAGATGKTGGVVAADLLARGKPVRVVVRDGRKGDAWRARGAEVAVASLDDEAALGRALEGASGLYVLLPEDPAVPGFHAHRRRMAEAIAGAVRAARTPHVVFLSTTAAVLADGNGPAKDLHHAEGLLRATGARVTVIRAGYLQENVAAALPAARHEGIYPCLLPSADVPVPMVATRDVGRLAARCLLEPPARSEIIDLLGPIYSARQAAEKLGALLGRPLRVIEIPPAAQADALSGLGLPREMAEAIAEMSACLAGGRVVPAGDRLLHGATTLDETLAALLGGKP